MGNEEEGICSRETQIPWEKLEGKICLRDSFQEKKKSPVFVRLGSDREVRDVILYCFCSSFNEFFFDCFVQDVLGARRGGVAALDGSCHKEWL